MHFLEQRKKKKHSIIIDRNLKSRGFEPITPKNFVTQFCGYISYYIPWWFNDLQILKGAQVYTILNKNLLLGKWHNSSLVFFLFLM